MEMASTYFRHFLDKQFFFRCGCCLLHLIPGLFITFASFRVYANPSVFLFLLCCFSSCENDRNIGPLAFIILVPCFISKRWEKKVKISSILYQLKRSFRSFVAVCNRDENIIALVPMIFGCVSVIFG